MELEQLGGNIVSGFIGVIAGVLGFKSRLKRNEQDITEIKESIKLNANSSVGIEVHRMCIKDTEKQFNLLRDDLKEVKQDIKSILSNLSNRRSDIKS